MSEASKENPLLKTVLEFGPLIIFFVAYYYAPTSSDPVTGQDQADTDRIIFATQIFVPAILIALFLGWVQTRKLAKMPLITAVLVVVFGGLTIWFKDPEFIKRKPTFIYLTFSFILLFGVWKRKGYLKILMGPALVMKDSGWVLLSKRFGLIFLLLAILNEIVRQEKYFSMDFWVNFKTFGMPGILLIFMAFQVGLLKKYVIETDVKDKKNNR